MKTVVLTDQVKKLIQLNMSTEDFMGVPGDFKEYENGKYGFCIDWDNLPQRYIDICNENINIIMQLTETRRKRNDILVGDYLTMPDLSQSRITYCWDGESQDGGGSGSFFLHKSGNASYSGSLNSSKQNSLMKLTGETKPALFWIFSRNWSGANRGFYFYLDVKVWKIENMFKTVFVKFDNWSDNYHTSVNGKLSDNEIRGCFVGKFFNVGGEMKQCKDCAIYY